VLYQDIQGAYNHELSDHLKMYMNFFLSCALVYINAQSFITQRTGIFQDIQGARNNIIFIEKVSRWHRVAYSKRIYKILVSEPARELGILGAKNEPRTKETVQVQRIQTLLKSLK